MDRCAAVGRVTDQIDGDHDLRAERAAKRDWNWIDQRAIKKPAPVDVYWLEYSRQCVRCANRIANIALGEPNLVTRPEFGCDDAKSLVETLEGHAGKFFFKLAPKPLAAEKTHPRQR